MIPRCYGCLAATDENGKCSARDTWCSFTAAPASDEDDDYRRNREKHQRAMVVELLRTGRPQPLECDAPVVSE